MSSLQVLYQWLETVGATRLTASNGAAWRDFQSQECRICTRRLNKEFLVRYATPSNSFVGFATADKTHENRPI
jgi:hypothetical protein